MPTVDCTVALESCYWKEARGSSTSVYEHSTPWQRRSTVAIMRSIGRRAMLLLRIDEMLCVQKRQKRATGGACTEASEDARYETFASRAQPTGAPRKVCAITQRRLLVTCKLLAARHGLCARTLHRRWRYTLAACVL
jgi:hypothetical protein